MRIISRRFVGLRYIHIWLVVSTHLKHISQIGNLPQIGVKIKKKLKPSYKYVKQICLKVDALKGKVISQASNLPKQLGYVGNHGDRFCPLTKVLSFPNGRNLCL